MARIRTVKPELYRHEILFEAEQKSQLPLRLAFIALFSCCDREGRFRWRPRQLKLDMLPYDDLDISLVLDTLVTCGFVMKYEKNGEIYGCIPSWSCHQHINNREANSELPSPEECNLVENNFSLKNKGIEVDDSSVGDASVTNNEHDADPSETCTSGKEGKRKGKEKEEKGSMLTSKTYRTSEAQSSHTIFNHWKETMNHPNAKLDDKRKSIIRKALKFGYEPDELCQAITGCSYTPHNMGDNERNQRYDGLHVILRDADQIDRFVHNYHHPPRPLSNAERHTQANRQAMEDWLKHKLILEENNHAKK